MTEFFRTVYAPSGERFFSRCLFVRDPRNVPVGTAFLWPAYGRITTLHWFKVKPAYENNGIGRAILSQLLSEASPSDFPVYLHTQPASYRAIKLYTDFGFRLITDDIVGDRHNHLRESLPILKEYLTDSAYANLTFSRAPAAFLQAAASSPISAF